MRGRLGGAEQPSSGPKNDIDPNLGDIGGPLGEMIETETRRTTTTTRTKGNPIYCCCCSSGWSPAPRLGRLLSVRLASPEQRRRPHQRQTNLIPNEQANPAPFLLAPPVELFLVWLREEVEDKQRRAIDDDDDRRGSNGAAVGLLIMVSGHLFLRGASQRSRRARTGSQPAQPGSQPIRRPSPSGRQIKSD